MITNANWLMHNQPKKKMCKF